jgi:TolB protein
VTGAFRRSVLAAGVLVGLVAGPLRGQTVELFVGYQTADSVMAIAIGKTGVAQLRVTNNCAGVSSYEGTIFLDDSRVRLVSAKGSPFANFPDPTVDSSVAGQLTLSASSPGWSSCTTYLADLGFEMDGAALQGSLLSLKVGSLVSADGTVDLVPTHRVRLLDVCQAVRVWGDVDSSLVVNSRDALIALTASVGITVTGFNLIDLADVDLDMQITSRDALFILSAGIGLYIPSNIFVGRAIPNVCAPLEPMPNDMAFWISSELTTVSTGDTTIVPLGVFGTSSWRPSWAPDASRILYTQSLSGYSYDFIAVTPDGLTADTLFVSAFSDFAPAWSPDGTRIAFVSSRVSPQALFIMDADGTDQIQLTTGDTITVFQVAWSPDGSTLTFTGYNSGACCTRKLWTIAPDGSGLAEVFPSSDTHAPQDPVWSPANDSIAYDYPGQGRIYRVAASGDTSGVPALSLESPQDYPGWVSSGMLFMSGWLLSGDYAFSRASDGRQLRLTRGLGYGGIRPDWRRIGVYVDTVTVSPKADTVVVGDSVQLSATVTNSDGSTNTTAKLEWISRDTALATVNSDGWVTGVAAGDVYIVATTGGWRSDSALVTVQDPPASPPIGALLNGHGRSTLLRSGVVDVWAARREEVTP